MSDELKPNQCQIEFQCDAPADDSCVYRTDFARRCTYDHHGFCGSAVAQVNRMTIAMKRLGVDTQPKEND